MKIYNTKTRQKEDLIFEDDRAKIYACGPTVYDLIHIGNARMIVIFDTFRRFLISQKVEVDFVQNFTDIDDKLINKAIYEDSTVQEIADKYIAEYEIDAAGLNILPPTYAPKVSENIPEIIAFVEDLIAKDFAYISNGDVYFNTANLDEYGKLSGKNLEDLIDGARVEASSAKKNPTDFVLWKSAKDGEPAWQASFGNGRPGWHIECSVMFEKYLGKTIDIHCGGADLIFPHHENERAQSLAKNDCEPVKYWIHNGYINIDNRKMSKSEGNFFTVRDVAKAHGYMPIRYMAISSHYRSPINFSADLLEQCKAALKRIYSCYNNLRDYVENAEKTDNHHDFSNYLLRFFEALADDFNTANAMGVMFDFVREINSKITAKLNKECAIDALKIFNKMLEVLGLNLDETGEKSTEIPQNLQDLLQQRQDARAAKDFALADKIRNEIASAGFKINDTPDGAKLEKI